MNQKIKLPDKYQKNITRAVEILKNAGCTEVFLFGSILGSLLFELDYPVDLVNLDKQDAFANYLKRTGELFQVG